MTRFLMSLDDSVDLVEYAFAHADAGDLFVRKAPACTVLDLARAVASLFGVEEPDIRILGTRHGEKLYESLLSREELQKADDRGDYYRVPLDARSLEYELFFDEGERMVDHDYTSHNTERLDVEAVKRLLLPLPPVRRRARRQASRQPRRRVVKVAITGGRGFLGWHTACRLRALHGLEPVRLGREEFADPRGWPRSRESTSSSTWRASTAPRPTTRSSRATSSSRPSLADALAAAGPSDRVVYANSVQADQDNPYGRGKAGGRGVLREAVAATGGALRRRAAAEPVRRARPAGLQLLRRDVRPRGGGRARARR